MMPHLVPLRFEQRSGCAGRWLAKGEALSSTTSIHVAGPLDATCAVGRVGYEDSEAARPRYFSKSPDRSGLFWSLAEMRRLTGDLTLVAFIVMMIGFAVLARYLIH